MFPLVFIIIDEDKQFAADALMDRLKDDTSDVVLVTLSVMPSMLV